MNTKIDKIFESDIFISFMKVMGISIWIVSGIYMLFPPSNTTLMIQGLYGFIFGIFYTRLSDILSKEIVNFGEFIGNKI